MRKDNNSLRIYTTHLLQLCLRWPQREEDRKEIVRLLSGTIDWQLFQKLADHHRVLPMVTHNVGIASLDARIEHEGVFAEVFAGMQKAAQENSYRALRCLTELHKIVRALGKRDVEICVLKGLPLARTVYGDLALRSVGDIDLLIDESRILAADQVLRELGYRASFDVGEFSTRRRAFYVAHWKDLTYTSDASGFEVDVHWRCFRNPHMSGSSLGSVAGAETVSFGGFQVRTLPRTEGLLYLCMHGLLDGWLYLKSLVDVGVQVRAMSEAELDRLAAAAADFGIFAELSATLAMVRRHLAMDHWSTRLLPEADEAVAHILRYADVVLEQREFLGARESVPISTTLAFEWGLRPDWRYRRELLLRVLFRVRMWQLIPLPDALFWLYPLLSPLEWILFRLRGAPAERAGEGS